MPFILNESICGISLFQINEEEINNVAIYEYPDSKSTAESIKLMKNHKFTQEILDFLKKEIKKSAVGKDNVLHISDKEMLPFLKENGIKAVNSPETIFKHKETLDKQSNFTLTTAEILARTKYIANELTSNIVQDNKDTLIIENVKLFDYLEKEINMHCMRIKEFYGLHFPELCEIINDNEKYLRLVLKIGEKETLKSITESKKDENDEFKRVKTDKSNDKKKSEKVSSSTQSMIEQSNETIQLYFEKMLPEIKKAAAYSVGSVLSQTDMSKIHADAITILKEMEHRAELSKYIKDMLTEMCPNALALVGQNTICKFIIKAGSLKDLAQMPSSTLQVLGAEKALFSSIRSANQNQPIKTPKYGVLFHTPLVSNTVPAHRGKMARMVAGKLAICLRSDYFNSKKEGKIGATFYEQLDSKRKKFNDNNSNKSKSNIKIEKRKKIKK